MLGFIIIIIIAIAVYSIFFSDKNEKTGKEKTPPSTDVTITGCYGGCGYGTSEFKQMPNGNYGGTNTVYCDYLKKSVKSGSKCPFAVDHPDKLTKGVFDSDIWDNLEL